MNEKSGISSRLLRVGCLALPIAVLLATPGHFAATPGLPFVEDFADTSLRDDPQTSANWSTDEQALSLAQPNPRFGAFGPGVVGQNLGLQSPRNTALGDVDGDGDLDLVAGNYNAANRLYLNNGTTDPWNGVTGVDITADSSSTNSVALGDVDGDGIQDPGEPGVVSAQVFLYDGSGAWVDATFTDTNGVYSFDDLVWTDEYSLRFFPPPGYVLSPLDQGGDDILDSDADPATGDTPVFTLSGFDSHTRWDAGVITSAPCTAPDEPIYLYAVTMSTDGNDYPILNFQDANQPTQITG